MADSRSLLALPMRSIVGIALVLVGIGLVSCQLEGTTVGLHRDGEPIAWVRTIDGWERPGDWLPTKFHSPSLHPLVVACSQALVSIFVLAAFATSAPRRR